MAWNPFPGIIENLTADAIVTALAAGGALTWLKRRGSTWLIPLCWGIGGAVVILIGFGAVSVIINNPTPDQSPRPTFDNVEGLIVTWLDNFGLVGEQNTFSDDAFFERIAVMPSGRHIEIGRPKKLSRYLELEQQLGPVGQDQEIIKKLTPSQVVEVTEDVQVEASRLGIGVQIRNPGMYVTLDQKLPIGTSLTEYSFIGALDQMDFASIVLGSEIHKDLQRLAR